MKRPQPEYDGRVTVPVLWDKQTSKIVNNCEDDICVMFNGIFDGVGGNKEINFFPRDIEAEQSKLSDFIYDNVNNGVYKAGFATRQRPYDIACRRLFEALDQLEAASRLQSVSLWQPHRGNRLEAFLHAHSF